MTSRQKEIIRLALIYFEANMDDAMDAAYGEEDKEENEIPPPTEAEMRELFYMVK